MGVGFEPQQFHVEVGFQARAGDVLVVSYPEVVLPLKPQYSSVRVGGITYTRQLVEGDDVVAEFETIYNTVMQLAAQSGEAKIIAWGTVLEQAGVR